MNDVEAKILLALQRRAVPVKATEIKGVKADERNHALAQLVTAGLATATGSGKTQLFAITGAGALACAAAPAKRTRAARAVPASASGPALAAIDARLGRMEAQLARLCERLAPPSPQAVDLSALKPSVLHTVTRLDGQNRYGGVVPIPALREELRRSGVQAADSDVDAALLSLERDFAVDLLVAQSPATVPDRSQGIERAGRGLVYYVAPRLP